MLEVTDSFVMGYSVGAGLWLATMRLMMSVCSWTSDSIVFSEEEAVVGLFLSELMIISSFSSVAESDSVLHNLTVTICNKQSFY